MSHAAPVVMISFSSSNKQEADYIEKALGHVGISLVRYENDLRPQRRIDLFLDRYLCADAMIVLLSETYFDSDICMAELMIASMPENQAQVYLVNVSRSPEYDVPAAATLSIHACLEKGEETWVREKLKSLANTDWEESVKRLLSKRFDRMPAFLTDGIAEICRSSNYMPTAYADMLNSIVETANIGERELAFDDYLQHFFVNEYYLTARAKSYANAGYIDLSELYYVRALSMNSKYPTAIVGLCRLAIDGHGTLLEGHFNEAMRLIRRKGLSRTERSTIAHALALVLLARATCEFNKERRRGRLRKAKSLLRGSICLAETDSAYNALGQVFEELGDFQGALNCYKKCLSLNADNYQALNNYALLCQRRLGKTKEAVALYGRCLEIKPDYGLALDGYGLALEGSSKDRSLQMYFKSFTSTCESTRAITNAALVLDEDYREYRGAEALYRVALQKKPTNIVTNYNMASFLRRRGKLTEEYMRCLSCISSASSNELVCLEFVLFNLCEKRYNEAAKYLKLIVANHTSSPHLFYISTLIGMLNGSFADAVLVDNDDFPPLLDLVARFELARGDEARAKTLYSRALEAIDDYEYPPLASIEETDFSAQLEWTEISFKRQSADRVARSQVVSIDGPILPPYFQLIDWEGNPKNESACGIGG